MTLIRRLALAVFSVLLCTSYSASNAQVIDYTTGNLITNTWQGTTPATNYNGTSGGAQPGYITNQKAIVFGYNQGTASQSIAIDAALNAAGAGVELKGYNYSWYYYNNDANRGNLTGNISLKSATGSVLQSNDYTMPQTGIGNWIQQSGSQVFTNQYQLNQVSTLDVSFTGKDDRWWAGYYGPAIKSINVKLMYGVNPCATNPAYSPECAGFANVLTSTNLVPNPDSYATSGSNINQSYAVNTALSAAGSNAVIHGFKWGYVANVNGPYCDTWFLVCLGTTTPKVTTNVNITSSTGASLYNVSRNYTDSYNTTDYQYLFPASKQMNTLGNFNFTATTYDQAYVGSMWSRAVYTIDPCVNNPLYSPTCSGYGAAIAGKTTTATTTTYTAPTTTAPTTASADPTQSAPTTTNVGGVELSTSGSISAPDGVPQVVKESQPAVSSTSSTTSNKPSSAVMNAVKAVQEANRATESRAVSNAQAAVATSTAQSQDAVSAIIANIATATTASAQASQPATIQSQSSSLGGISLNRPAVQTLSISNNVGTSVSVSSNSVGSVSVTNSVLTETSTQMSSGIEYKLDRQSMNSTESQGITQQQNTARTDPLSMMMQQPNMLQQTNIEQRSETVKKNVQPNELAGGVDIAAMAAVPTGFGSYSLMMRDSAFYAPKEIYRNQNVVDNARALRQLGSDQKHKELVNSQYK